MAISSKVIKNRIKSVKNTKKITKAMQMIAAVKMRKAVQLAISTKEYANLTEELQTRTKVSKHKHPFSLSRKVKNILLVIISSNKGLCGNYNAEVLKQTKKLIENYKSKDVEINLSSIVIGSKINSYLKKNKIQILGIFDSLPDNPKISDIYPIAEVVKSEFKQKKVDEVNIVYTEYVSALRQVASIMHLLPIKQQNNSTTQDFEVEKQNSGSKISYLFEPSKQKVIESIFPMLVDLKIYQAILESFASEQSSRMMAMQSATDSANEMIETLTLEFNKNRQAAITQEISEIVGGTLELI